MNPGYIIFGSTGAIGSALVQRLSSRGYPIIAAGRSDEKLTTLASQGSNITPFTIDLNDPSTFKRCFVRAREQFGQVLGVANCIGSVLLKSAHLTSDDEWLSTLQTNLNSAFYVVREAALAMRSSGGSVVLVSSAAALAGMANHEAIAAAKGGIIGLTRSAAASYAASNLRFNAVAPGLVQSEMTRRIWDNEAMRKASEDMHALGRIGQPDEVASLIEWLLLPENTWITGQIIGIDGGLSNILPRPKHKAS